MKINRPEDIALILPPRRLRERRYSLGILYVSAYLRQHGYDNVILENKFLGKQFYQRQTNEQIEKGIIDKLVEIKPRVIGFTSSTIEINDVIEMNKKIRQQIDAVSIIGGPHVTAAPKEVLEKGFDIAVIGEGEETVFELIKELEKDNPNLSLVNGIVWKNEKNQIITNPSRELIDISNLVMPAYDKFYMDRYLVVSDETLRGVPIKAAIVMASRGCPYPCTFCACNKVFGRRVRYRNLENIRVEIKTLKHQYGAEGIWFADDTMTISKEHVQKICQLMKEEGMLWGAQARVDLADEETIKLMKESGCIQLEFGVESGNQRVLDEIIKKALQ
ncbi:MAG: radical SAM protein [bacterium]